MGASANAEMDNRLSIPLHGQRCFGLVLSALAHAGLERKALGGKTALQRCALNAEESR